MQRLVECNLCVNSEINGNFDCTIIKGKGYYRENNNEIIIYFVSEDVKYKYVYSNECLIVYCNDSYYKFILNKESMGEIKNGDYVFKITTFATKIDVCNNLIVLEYNLGQQGTIIGKYKSKLSF